MGKRSLRARVGVRSAARRISVGSISTVTGGRHGGRRNQQRNENNEAYISESRGGYQ